MVGQRSHILRHFNPRSPHGERRGGGSYFFAIFCKFQPTLPARGATVARKFRDAKNGYFNPRSPHGERQRVRDAPTRAVVISTHAPRTGSDSACVMRPRARW